MMDRRRNPPFVHEYTNRHGTTVYYLRRPGHKKIRLKIPDGALPWSPRFMEAYDAAMSSAPDAPAISAGRSVPDTVNATMRALTSSKPATWAHSAMSAPASPTCATARVAVTTLSGSRIR
jgi:hypothetical protein